jgi:transcriptional regulator with XRE-family HTH domain
MIESGLTIGDLAARVSVDPKTVERWISPGRTPRLRHQRAVATVLGREITDFWPDRRRDVAWFRPWREVERDAVELRSFQPLIVPGLLQTEAYARAVLAGAGKVPRDQVDKQVKARMERQHILTRIRPPEFTAIVEEYALRRPIGGPAVMKGQLQRLVEVADDPHTRLYVVPAGAGAYAGTDGPFVLASGPGSHVAGFLDGQLSGQLVEYEGDVAVLWAAWDSCRGEALPHRESVKLIEEIAQIWT